MPRIIAALLLLLTLAAAPAAHADPLRFSARSQAPGLHLAHGRAARLAALDVDEGPRPKPRHRLGRVALLGGAQLAIQYAALLALQPPNWRDHGNSLTPSWDKFSSNFEVAPAWSPEELGGGGSLGYLQADGDSWETNVLGHGLQGSEIYLRMRREDYGVAASFAAGVLHSTTWEYLVEGWNETPSSWDLIYTPIGGAVLGELRYVLAKELEPWEDTPLGFGLLALIDPVGVTF